jgi:glycosyltransferase involved in cell wall biosynthesis
VATPTFDPTAPCIVLAPHLQYPARNGSDISLDRIAKCFSRHVPHVDLIAEDVVVSFRNGEERGRVPFANGMRSKRSAGLRALVRRSHFYLEKFVTPAFSRRAAELIGSNTYGTILYSYMTTTRATTRIPSEQIPATRLIWTHNDEFKWFRDLALSTPGPLGRQVARNSEAWLHDFFRSRADEYMLLHVTEEDRAGYDSLYPGHRCAQIPIGVDLPSDLNPPVEPERRPVKLIFVGSLGVRMNRDALAHFGERFHPLLHETFGSGLEVHVAGSSPSTEIMALCNSHRWQLHSDLPDARLEKIIESATFSLLPFSYATGAKLKLLKSMAHGVPFLATRMVAAQADACIYPSLMSDEPEEWVQRIQSVLREGISSDKRASLRDLAQQHSWEASVQTIIDALSDATVETHS